MKKLIKIFFRVIAVALIIVLLAGGAWVGYYFYRSNPKNIKSYDSNNAFVSPNTMVSAHRSGGGIVPEETMAAFKYCVESDMQIDIFEFDLHLTADNVLVLLHDAELDRTSDSEDVFGAVGTAAHDKTYDELRQLNMGAKYVNEAGEMPYAGLRGDDVPDDVRIATLDEVLDYLTESGDYKYIIEIKDGDALGEHAADMLYENVSARGILDKVIFSSFHSSIMDYVAKTYPETNRGAATAQATEFYFAALLGRKNYEPTFNTLQMPFNDFKESYGANFGTARVINYAHEHGLAAAFWTINDEEDMEYLISIGADAIITDYPDRLNNVMADKFCYK